MIETNEIEFFSPGELYPNDLYIEDLVYFGWQKTQVVERRVSRSTSKFQIMARETTMPNYEELHKLELEYEDQKMNLQYYQKASKGRAFRLLLLLIFPGVLYITYKTKQKNKIKENNETCIKNMKEIVEKAKAIRG